MSVQTEIVPQADFSIPKAQSIIAQRSHVKISPKYGGPFRPLDTIRLEIPSQNWLDSENTAVSFNVVIKDGPNGAVLPKYWNEQPVAHVQGATLGKLDSVPNNAYNTAIANANIGTPTGGSYGRVKNGVQSIFNRVKLLQGSNVIEDIQEYNSLWKILSVTSAPVEWRETTGEMLEGYGDMRSYEYKKKIRSRGSTIQTFAPQVHTDSTNGHEYYCQLNLGLLQRAGKYLPLKYTGQFTIELYLEEAAECLASSVDHTVGANRDQGPITPTLAYPNLTYVVDNVNLHCHFIVPIEEYDKAMLAKIQEGGGIDIHYDTYSTHTRQIPYNAVPSKSTHSFQERAVSVRGGFAVMRNSANISDLKNDGGFSANNIRDFQWKLGSMYSPSQPVECRFGGAEAMVELQEALGTWADIQSTGSIRSDNFCPDDTPGSVTKYDVTELLHETERPYNFIMGLNLEKTLGQLSGFNTSSTNTDVELILNLGPFQRAKYRYIDKSGDPAAWQIPDVDGYTTATAHATGRRDLPIGVMSPKPLATFARLTFFAHVDSVFKIMGLGSIQVLR